MIYFYCDSNESDMKGCSIVLIKKKFGIEVIKFDEE